MSINIKLVGIYNSILTIEENAFKNENFDDITVKEVHTIAAIKMYEPKSMTEIARDLGITVGTLTVAVNNLVKKGYAKRFKSEDDRRIVRVGLTSKGRLVCRVHDKFHMELVKTLIGGLDEKEEAVLLKALDELNEFIHDTYFNCKGES